MHFRMILLNQCYYMKSNEYNNSYLKLYIHSILKLQELSLLTNLNYHLFLNADSWVGSEGQQEMIIQVIKFKKPICANKN